MVSLYPGQLECIAFSLPVTLGTKTGQPECIAVSQSVTLSTKASQPQCIAISRAVTLGSEPVGRSVKQCFGQQQ